MPQTIRDALKIIQSLGFRFIWIDALCIVQDSVLHRTQELGRMAQIYENAFVTIVASSASSASDGFLHQHRPLPNQPLQRSRTAGQYAMPCRLVRGNFCAVDMKQTEIMWAAWNSEPIFYRCWTLQEALLSKRCLIYSAQTLSWHSKDGLHLLDDVCNDTDTLTASYRFPLDKKSLVNTLQEE